MFNWLFKKRLEDVLTAKKKVVIKGILFEIKKIDVLTHLKGSNALMQCYKTFSLEKEINLEESIYLKRLKEHYSEVFLASVLKPKLSKKDDTDSINVEEMFKDWELCEKLYNEIVTLTYGKKKMLLPR